MSHKKWSAGMQQTENIKPRTNPIQALRRIFHETTGARTAAEKLEPLLQLLQEQPEERSALQELTDTLETILLGQRQTMLMLEDMDRKLDQLLAKR